MHLVKDPRDWIPIAGIGTVVEGGITTPEDLEISMELMIWLGCVEG